MEILILCLVDSS